MDGNTLQHKLAALVSEIRSVQLGSLEGVDPCDDLSESVLPRVREIGHRALDLLIELEDRLEEAVAGKGIPSWLEGSRAEPPALESFSAICFMARIELRPIMDQLDRPPSQAPQDQPCWDPLVRIERLQGSMTNGLCAVESELAQILGQPSRTKHIDLLRDSLEARRTTTKFRRDIVKALLDHPDSAEERLRRAGSSLVRLIGRDAFACLFASDRLLARDLRDRILTWMREPRASEGDRLWEEVYAFAVLLSRLNGRAELIRHDVVVMQKLVASLSLRAPHEQLPAEAVEHLQQILGRDDHLDKLVAAGAPVGRVLPRLQKAFRALTDGQELTADIPMDELEEMLQ